MSMAEVVEIFHCKQNRKFNPGMKMPAWLKNVFISANRSLTDQSFGLTFVVLRNVSVSYHNVEHAEHSQNLTDFRQTFIVNLLV